MRILYEISESFRIAFAQIVANKLRSALTALGVVIGQWVTRRVPALEHGSVARRHG